MKPEALERLGLSPNESKIYLALLEEGECTADKISQKAGIHRRTIYDNIEKLLHKGLIHYVIKGKKKFFGATEPYQLQKLMSEKKTQLSEQENLLSQLMPQLSALSNLSQDKHVVTVYKGMDGIKSILWSILEEGKPNCVIGAHSREEFKDMLETFHDERIKKKISNRMIFKREDRDRAKRFSSRPYTQVRLMPSEYTSPIVINTFGDTVALLIRSDYPLGIVIKNKHTADGFRAYFGVLWKHCEKV